MSKQVVVYIPAIHVGYERFLERHLDATEVLILGSSFSEFFPWMRKEIRALDPHHALRYLTERFRGVNLRVVEARELSGRLFAETIVMPDEDLSRELAGRYLAGRESISIYYESIWLRWDRTKVLAEEQVSPDEVVSLADLDRRIMQQAMDEGQKSADWWRQVGAVAIQRGYVVGIHRNHHLPSDHVLDTDGDPRGVFSRGEQVDLGTVIHAEADLIATAARSGLALGGAELYSTTFPCPSCAKLIASAGFVACYYLSGYAMIDGVRTLRDAGVRLIRVDMTSPPSA